MGSYLVNFSLYTLAMVGVIFCALFIFKLVMGGKVFTKKSAFVKVIDAVKLSPRKTLYVIKAGNEKFLVASDTDRTTLISKLSDNSADNALNSALEKASETEISDYENDVFSEKIESSKDIFHKSGKYDFLSRPSRVKPKIKKEKREGLNSLYGENGIEEEFASVLKLRKDGTQQAPMMKEIARKLNF